MTKWYLAAVAAALTAMSAQARDLDRRIEACTSCDDIARVLEDSVNDVREVRFSIELSNDGGAAAWNETVALIAGYLRTLKPEADNREAIVALVQTLVSTEQEGVSKRMAFNFIENEVADQVDTEAVDCN